MAERELTAGVLAAIVTTPLRPVLFFEGEFVSAGVTDTLRLFTGLGSFVWNGVTWTGGGGLLSISAVQEKSSLEAVGFAVSLSGFDGALLSRALQSVRKNRPGKLWLGFYDAAGALIADPYLLRRGRFDVTSMRRDPAGGTFTIEARYEDRLVDLERPRERRYTHEDQQLRLAGDLGFDQVQALQDAQDVWGNEVPAVRPVPSVVPGAWEQQNG